MLDSAQGAIVLRQEWSRAFYDHPDNADGILYRSRHDPKQQLAALFDRFQSLLTMQQHGSLQDYLGDEFFALLDHEEIALLQANAPDAWQAEMDQLRITPAKKRRWLCSSAS